MHSPTGHHGSSMQSLRPVPAMHRCLRTPFHAHKHVRHRAMHAARACAVVAAPPQAADIKQILETLIEGRDLTEQQTQEAMEALVDGAAETQMAAFLVLLRAKGETAEEVTGLAKAMRARCIHVPTSGDVLDIVGTGGDGIGSVNISTGATVIAAAAGAKVAKHGNRSVSSLCGSADVLEALGVAVDIGPEGVARCIRECGVGFMFAPRYHPAMKAVVPVRKSLKVRTAFNILGPMLNPAGAAYGLIGVYSPAISGLMASTLQRLGTKRALVVHSHGLDELTPMGDAEVLEVTPQGTRSYRLDPLDLGIKRCEVNDLAGGDARLNASILEDVFGGAQNAVADALNLNAGVALAACEVAGSPQEGVAMAQNSYAGDMSSGPMQNHLEANVTAPLVELSGQDQSSQEAQRSGKAAHVLTRWREISRSCQ